MIQDPAVVSIAQRWPVGPVDQFRELIWPAKNRPLLLRLFDEEAVSQIREQIGWIRQRLDEAERALDAGRTPSSCGVIQGAGGALDLAVGRLHAIRDARPAIDILISTAEGAAEKGA